MSDRVTVALFAVCVAGGVGGALFAAGILTPSDDAAPPVGEQLVDVQDPSAHVAEPATSGPESSRGDPLDDEQLREAAPPQVALDEARSDRVRALGWDEAVESLASAEAWSAADDGHRQKVARRVAARSRGLSYQRFETFAGAGRKHHLAVFHHASTGLEMVLLPGGTFTMGSPEGEPGRDSHEQQHEVVLSPFLISRTEVTQSAWLRVYEYAELMPSRWRGPDLPVETISRDAAAKFCQRVGGRLPTEAEWEYACRGGGVERFWFGDDEGELSEHAWVQANSGLHTHPVGLFDPNPFGLYDMHGNVWEWVSDRFAAYASEAVTDPGGAESGSTTIRGGSWWDTPKDVRSAKRLAWTQGQHNVGFRLAKSVE